MIIARTPFRISFFGGGTDFPEFYSEYGGATLLTTINKYCYISIHELSSFFKYNFRASYAKTESVLTPADFQHPLIRECLLMLDIKQGLEISHVSDLPGRTGLGTSSSFTVGMLHVLHTLCGHHVHADALAREAIIVERERVGDFGGHQDQYAAAYGGFMRLNFSGDQHVEVKRLDLTEKRIENLTDHLLLFYTGIESSAEAVLKEQCEKIKGNVSVLKEMLQMVDEAESLLSGSSDFTALGKLLHESWIRKRGLARGITNTTIDQAYEAALATGASGGKLLGAGGRGFLLILATPEKHQAIRTKLSRLLEVPFSLGSEGSCIIFQTEKD